MTPPGEARSSVALLADGMAAFALRAATARAATRSLDLQYYIWKADLTGKLLAREALLAADRGVRVRILLDDLPGLGRSFGLAALGAHPGIELRRFNATTWRRWGRAGLALQIIFGRWRLNRRMHNKAWIADQRLLICGGRNIGDSYFEAHEGLNFRDLDLAIEGAAATAASDVFDGFWNCQLAWPIRRLGMRPGRRSLRRLRWRLERLAESLPAQRYLAAVHPCGTAALRGLTVPDADIRLLADPPQKAEGLAGSAVAPALGAMLDRARREALLISPYFVPGEAGAARLIRLARSGVRVAVITNSLAATDAVAAHAGYARYRRMLLEGGVELHELKHAVEPTKGPLGSSTASLHTKAVLVDDGPLFIGSFNLDPRSANLNTEMGVLLDHRGMARLLRGQHRTLTEGAACWRLRLQDGRVVWEGSAVSEPGASRPRRLAAWLLGRLPIEPQL